MVVEKNAHEKHSRFEERIVECAEESKLYSSDEKIEQFFTAQIKKEADMGKKYRKFVYG